MKRVGLIINPIAGIGGKVGLKGSDGPEIYRKALELGAVPEAAKKAMLALEKLLPVKGQIRLFTYSGAMGENLARSWGFEPYVIGNIRGEKSTNLDTQSAAKKMLELGTDLILFAGGDGTARDICGSIGTGTAALGIPAGVKMHSAVFAVNPRSAGDLALSYITGEVTETREAEVIDIDEDEYRNGRLCTRLYGYLKIPFRKAGVQGLKCSGFSHEKAELDSIASYVIDNMDDGCYYLIGAGTTTRAIMDKLGLPNSLLGVDAIYQGKLVAGDINEKQIIDLLKEKAAKIVVSPIGGQGYIFGRGNQQFSAEVIKRVGRKNIIVVSTKEKLISLQDKALYVDTGDSELDEMLKGYYLVITGYEEEVACNCKAM